MMRLIDPADLPASVSEGPKSWGEAWLGVTTADKEQGLVESDKNADRRAITEAYERKIADIEKITGHRLENPMSSASDLERDLVLNAGLGLSTIPLEALERDTGILADKEERFNNAARALAERFPAVNAVIASTVKEQKHEVMRDREEKAARAAQAPELGPIGRFTAHLAGGLWAAAYDPDQWAMMTFGAGPQAARTVAGRIGKTMMTEALLNGGQELVLEAASQQRKKEAGLEYGMKDMLANAGIAAVFGSLFGGTAQGGSELARIFRFGKDGAERATRILEGRPDAGDIETTASELGVELTEENRRILQRAFDEQTLDDAMISPHAPAEGSVVVAAARRHALHPDRFPEPELVERGLYDRRPGGPRSLGLDDYQRMRRGDVEAADTFRKKAVIDAVSRRPLDVVTPTGLRVAVRQEVVDAADLVKASGELQPRDRARAASDAQINEMASRLDPALLMHAPTSDRGAPIVGPDGIVESGNGRVAALSKAAEAYPERFQAYKQALRDAGFDVPEKGVPILISRRITELAPDERVAFVNASNTSGIAALSATEKAAMDVRAMTAGVLDAYVPGSINSAANRHFVAGFMNNLPSNERFGLIDAHGHLNADGIRRIENAMIAAAYGDADVIARFAETPDDNVSSIMGAMSDVAGQWAAMRRDIADGVIEPSLDVTENLTDALRFMSRAREKALLEKRPVATVIREELGQIDLLTGEVAVATKAFIRSFYKNDNFRQANGRDLIATHLQNIIRHARELGHAQLFGDLTKVERQELILNARPKDGQSGAGAQADFFQAGNPRAGGGNDSGTDGIEAVQGTREGLALGGEQDSALVQQDARREFRADVPKRNIDELYAVAQKWQDDLDAVGRLVSGELGVEWKNAGIKQKAASIEKMARKRYRDTRQLTDVVRGGFVVDGPAQADAIAERLAASFDALDEGWNSTTVGYIDRKILVKFADGTIGEVQIWPRAMLKAKDGMGHKLYEQMRVLSPDHPDHEVLGSRQQEVYSAAAAELSPEWSSLLSDGTGGTFGNNLANSASVTRRPDSRTSAVLTAVQGSPSSRTAQERHDLSMTAGRSSQSMNDIGGRFLGSMTRENIVSTSDIDIVGQRGNVKAKGDLISDNAHEGLARIRPADASEPDSKAASAKAEMRAGEILDPQIDADGNAVSLFEWLPVTDGDGNTRLVSAREALALADEAEFQADILGACKL
jgi:hypothetical protein